ncbi:MAG: LacI family DNA-binding transcriptional regulator [Bacteroidales bacterium]
MKKTIYDVAKDMNLSPGTISKILHNKGNVNQKTRERVLNYVKEIGFVADYSARILKAKKSSTLGIVFSDIAHFGLEHPFFSSVLQHFKNYVENLGYEIVFIVNRIGEQELSYLKWCKVKKVDGVLIVTGNINKPNIIELVNSDIPSVSVDIQMNNLITVISDDDLGIKLGVGYAIQIGLKHLCCIPGPLTSRAYYERLDSFKRVLEGNNFVFNDKNFEEAESYGFTGGYNATRRLLDKNEESPDFIFAFSDELAFGVIRCLEDSGYKVPEDVSVIGYDDVYFAKHFSPALTTIRQDKKEIGEVAAQKLLDMINEKILPKPFVERIPVMLVVRKSTI